MVTEDDVKAWVQKEVLPTVGEIDLDNIWLNPLDGTPGSLKWNWAGFYHSEPGDWRKQIIDRAIERAASKFPIVELNKRE